MKKMNDTAKRHMKALMSGTVEKTNVIGLKKVLNAQWRRNHGYSVSRVAPKVTADEVRALENTLATQKPVVKGDLHDSGIKLLQGKRYRHRLEPVADIVANLDHFRLIGFQEAGEYRGNHIPVYRAVAKGGRSFDFINVPWQSGGDGPELLRR